MALLLGSLFIFAALFIVFSAVSGMGTERSGVSRSIQVLEAMTGAPEELKKELNRSFGERVLEPLYQRAQALGARITGADQIERIRQKLDRAGNPPGWTVDRVATGKVLGVVCGFAFSAFLAYAFGFGLGPSLLIVIVGTVFGFQAPSIYLYNTALKRDAVMQKAMADAIDLLTISVEAGLGFDAALQQVAKNTEGPLAAEFGRVLQEMQIGRGRADAMRALGERSSLPDVRSFVSAMVQAESFGIPIAQVLRVQSSEIRIKRRQRAEEKAAQVPVKIMVPVVLFILPCLMIIVIGPAAISITNAFANR
jgi:tight adherence protein C